MRHLASVACPLAPPLLLAVALSATAGPPGAASLEEVPALFPEAAGPTPSTTSPPPVAAPEPPPLIRAPEPRPPDRARRAARLPVRLGFGVGFGRGQGPGDWYRRFFQDAKAGFRALVEKMKHRPVFGGFLAVGLASTRDGRGSSGIPPATRYTAGRADQTFFTLPQASISMDASVGEKAQVHVQLDLPTDPIDPLGGSPGLNEAYVLFRDFPRGLALRVGGYSPPLASWEVNGPFLTLNDTITHSSVNTPFESGRVVGLELTNALAIDDNDLSWSFGLYAGADTAASSGHSRAFGQLHDGLGLGSLGNLSVFDDRLGWFLDVEAPPRGRRRAGWRVSWQDVGGDLGASRPSQEQDVWQLGAWRRWGRWRLQSQVAGARTRTGTSLLDETDSRAGYLLLNRRLGEGATATLRYDRFWNRSPAQRDRGEAWTAAWNRTLGQGQMLQFEVLHVEQTPEPGLGRGDVADDLVQLRYMVWF